MAALGQRVSTQIGKTTQRDRQIEKKERKREREREREREIKKLRINSKFGGNRKRSKEYSRKIKYKNNCEKLYQGKTGLSDFIRPSISNTVENRIKITKPYIEYT